MTASFFARLGDKHYEDRALFEVDAKAWRKDLAARDREARAQPPITTETTALSRAALQKPAKCGHGEYVEPADGMAILGSRVEVEPGVFGTVWSQADERRWWVALDNGDYVQALGGPGKRLTGCRRLRFGGDGRRRA